MEKEFELIVSIFKILSGRTRKSHVGEILTYAMVAKIKVHLVILNLDYKELNIEMFKHFLKPFDLNGRMFSHT